MIACPHCGKDQDSYAQVRVGGLRFHMRCYAPWLRAALIRAEADIARLENPRSVLGPAAPTQERVALPG